MPEHPGAKAIADSIEALTVLLRADLARVWARVTTEVQTLEENWPAIGPATRRARLAQLRAHLGDLADAADEIAARHVLAGVRDAYLLGAHATALTVGEAVATTGVDLQAITVLAADTHADLLAATTHMRASAKDLIRTLARDHVADRLYTGTPATQAGRDLAKALRASLGSEKVSAITYADGSRHGLAEYASMVIRTKTAEAYQVGGFNQAGGFGVAFMEIMDGPGCGLSSHDDTQLANGMILPLEQARAYPTSHPNCRRVSLPRPDIKSLIGATPIGPQFTPTQLLAATASGDVGFSGPLPRRGNGTLAPAAAIAKGPAAKRVAALQARRATAGSSHLPESNATAVAERMVDAATRAEPPLTTLVSGLADQHGGTMAGMDFRLKGVGSLTRKITSEVADSGGKVSPAQAGAKMFDVNRYTTVYTEAKYAPGAQATIDTLRAQGHTLKVKNYWNVETRAYQGVNVQVTTTSAEKFELQFHTPTSLAVKEGELHRLYELQRVEKDPAKWDDYERQMFHAAAKIPLPPGIASVH